jgi:membrane fusion protein (multidrug efflux system)
MPLLEQETARLQTALQALAAQQTALTTQLTTQQQAVTAAHTQRTNALNGVTQAQARIPPLQAAAAAADAQVAEAQQDLLDASEPPPGIPPASWRLRLTALRRKLTQAQTAATAAHAKVTEAQQGVAQAQAQVQAADRQIAAATAAVQATQAAIGALQPRRQALQATLTEIEGMNAEITRDPMARAALQQVAAQLSSRTATLEESHLVARFELEDAETLLANSITRRNELTTLLAGLATQIPQAEAQAAAAQQSLVDAEAEVTALLQEGPLSL